MCRRFPRSEAFKIPYAGLATYSVSLTVVDDEGTSSTGTTSAVISGEAVLDLDISTFKVARTGRVGKPLAIELTVANDGAVLRQAIATVVGVKDGVEVYNWRLNVYDYIG